MMERGQDRQHLLVRNRDCRIASSIEGAVSHNSLGPQLGGQVGALLRKSPVSPVKAKARMSAASLSCWR